RFSELLKDYPINKTSITELEIRFGVFKNPKLKEDRKAFFYIRDEEVSRRKLQELGIEQEFEKVTEFIKDLEKMAREYPSIQVMHYKDTEELISLVEKDLIKEIDNLFP
ncbi:MAG: hypothetical protein RMJ32_04535, partial [Aquificaceae bacterium]|nr:hypothetical protein [Aquificaceae bacterium]